ncbi:hypothetical protein EUX98_g7349 [Antrodiella citrinella]|uniref:RBR-type E3 ubiquitin transferase n=1 Tax=Antrodiella citrinella TaxID=2447956 RepID=A0A4S4MLQ3_9APHY|nr:hypothetical protein EUX98_g7349 [Antrodiella citrinella]
MSSDYELSDNEYYDEDDDEVMYDDEDGSASEMDVDFRISPNTKVKSYEIDFDSLSQAQVEKQISQDVEDISGIFGVEPEVASLLLRNYNWNKERLIEKYMDSATAVSIAAGLALPEKPDSSSRSRATQSQPVGAVRRTTRRNTNEQPKSGKTKILERVTPPLDDQPFVCPICFDDSQTKTMSLQCNHKFCTECWNAYTTSKIRTEAEHWITCMAEDCKLVATDDFVKSALKDDADVFTRYQELVVRHYVSCNKNLKYCPYPSCTHTVSCPAGASKSALTTIVPIVTCGASAGHKFCFGCNVDADHRPVVCGVAKMWLQKCQDDSETANWIKSNTKECSKCQSTIEKNGGCNHMTCKKCKYEFCWVCMGPWTEHGTAWYSCNRYDEKASIDARDAQSRSRASLERYLHYYNRWANHEQSAKLSVELYTKTERKMEEMQITSDMTWIEVQFMKKAVDEVFKCRMTLKWTYAMAYYLEKNNQKELFEDNQRDLERAVEELSELIESSIDPESALPLRQKVTDKTVYVQKRNEIMLEDTANGFLEGRWKWNMSIDGFDEPTEYAY